MKNLQRLVNSSKLNADRSLRNVQKIDKTSSDFLEFYNQKTLKTF